jgi:hypothetical protein
MEPGRRVSMSVGSKCRVSELTAMVFIQFVSVTNRAQSRDHGKQRRSKAKPAGRFIYGENKLGVPATEFTLELGILPEPATNMSLHCPASTLSVRPTMESATYLEVTVVSCCSCIPT